MQIQRYAYSYYGTLMPCETGDAQIVKLENLAEEIQKNQKKWIDHALNWEALSDDYCVLLVKERKISMYNGLCAVGFLITIILQNLGVIPCLK